MSVGAARLQDVHAITMSRVEARRRIEAYLTDHPFLKEVLHTRSWTQGDGTDVLHADSIFGTGSITLTDGTIEIDLQLTTLGQAARSTISSVLSSAIVQLLSESP